MWTFILLGLFLIAGIVIVVVSVGLNKHKNSTISQRLGTLETWVDTFIGKLKRHESFGFAHYNDGEMACISHRGTVDRPGEIGGFKGDGTPWQEDCSVQMTEALRHGMEHPPTDFYVGVPCTQCHPWQRKLADTLTRHHREQTVPAMTFHHTRFRYQSHKKLVAALRERLVYLVVSDDADVDLYFTGHLEHLVDTIYVPASYASHEYDRLLTCKFVPDSVVVLCCGLLGRMISPTWYANNPQTTILCLGSFFDEELYGHNDRAYMKGQLRHCECYPY